MLAKSIARPPGMAVRSRASVAPSMEAIPRTVRWSFLLFVFSLAFESVSIPYVTSGFLTLPKLMGLGFAGLYFFHLGIPLKKSFPAIPAAIWWFFIYFIIIGLTGFFIEDQSLRQYLSRLLTLAQLFVLCWCSAQLLKNTNCAKKFLLIFAIGCVIVAVGSLLGAPGFAQSRGGDRITAFEYNPNYLAAIMGYAAISIIALTTSERNWSPVRKFFTLGSLLPLSGMMVFSGSRSGIVAFFIGISILMFPHRGSRWIKAVFVAMLVLGSVAFYLMAYESASTARLSRMFQEGETAGRWEIYSAALEMISEKPLLGWGGETATQELGFRLGLSGARDAHNLILFLLIEVGVIGTIPFLAGLFFCVRAAWRGRAGPLGILPFAMLMTALAHSMVHTGIRVKIFWLILALSMAAGSAVRSRIKSPHYSQPTISRERRPRALRHAGANGPRRRAEF